MAAMPGRLLLCRQREKLPLLKTTKQFVIKKCLQPDVLMMMAAAPRLRAPQAGALMPSSRHVTGEQLRIACFWTQFPRKYCYMQNVMTKAQLFGLCWIKHFGQYGDTWNSLEAILHVLNMAAGGICRWHGRELCRSFLEPKSRKHVSEVQADWCVYLGYPLCHVSRLRLVLFG